MRLSLLVWEGVIALLLLVRHGQREMGLCVSVCLSVRLSLLNNQSTELSLDSL